MKVICDRHALLDAVNLTSGVVVTRTPRPQLTCIHLTAEKRDDAARLTLTATDAEISLTLHLDRVTVEEPGEALIPADKLRQIVSAEDADATLALETEGQDCHIRGEDARFKVYGYPPADFPPIPTFEEVTGGAGGRSPAKAVFEYPAGPLTDLIARTVFATARENSRYAINGVLLRREGKKIEMVATDGRRLAVSRANLPSGDKDAEAVSCIVPTKALTMLQKLVDDDEERVHIALSDNQIFFHFAGNADGRALLASNLVEGTFPPYEDAIPRDQDKAVTFDRDVLSSAVRRAALLTNEESRGVRLAFHGGDQRLEISSRAPEMGEAQINIDLAEYKGDDIEIGFNPAFITDALKVIDDPKVVMELKSPTKQAVIKSGNEFLYVVMPVTL